jgi:hypothetical protein
MDPNITTLAQVLGYQKPGVVRRYAKEHGVSPAEAEELFREMLKWLYLCYRGSIDGVPCAMYPEIAAIDEMWHTFLMFTHDYAQFCRHYFGFFLHHVPNEDEEEMTYADPASVQAQLEAQYMFTFDVLGEETLRVWFEEERYAAPALR